MQDFNLNLGSISASDTIPDGDYTVAPVSFEIKSNAKGSYINGEFSVLDQSHKGFKIFETFSLENMNPQAVEIGRKKIKKMCIAYGMNGNETITMAALQSLVGKPITAAVKVQEGNDGYDDRSVISKFHPVSNPSAQTEQPVQGVAPTQQAQNASPQQGAPASSGPSASNIPSFLQQ